MIKWEHSEINVTLEENLWDFITMMKVYMDTKTLIYICIGSISTTTLTLNVFVAGNVRCKHQTRRSVRFIHSKRYLMSCYCNSRTWSISDVLYVVDKMTVLMFFGCAFFVLNWLECIESHFENRKAQIIHHNDSKARHFTWGIMLSNNQYQMRLFRLLSSSSRSSLFFSPSIRFIPVKIFFPIWRKPMLFFPLTLCMSPSGIFK